MSNQLPESLKRITKAGLRGRPKVAYAVHHLTRNQRIIMRQKGFLPREIRGFDETKSTDFRSVYFQRMMRSRAKYVEAMKLNGWAEKEVLLRISKTLHRMTKGDTGWTFFRLEYATVSQKPTLSGGKFATFLKDRRRISANLGRAYGRIQLVQRHFYKGLPGLPRKRS